MFKCSNCNIVGHHFRQCTNPITSFGIISFRHKDPHWIQAQCLAEHDNHINGLAIQNVEFLLIQRKDSIGYVEMIRGKYNPYDKKFLQEQINGTTAIEREKLLHGDFNTMWSDVWGPENKHYRGDSEISKKKLETLRTGYTIPDTNEFISMELLVENASQPWSTPEWGFPKGRRNPFESDIDCAYREFSEETGLTRRDIRVFENISPIVETFLGNNQVQYTHIYYLGWISHNIPISLLPNHSHMAREIGAIGWYSLEEALQKIRPNNVEKREVLLRASSMIRNLCPLLIGPIQTNT
jgi:8-oxo-dGTP pyrophosphatase MutT (NUDIX family)